MPYLVKIIVTAILVMLISEVAKRWTLAGAIIASIPLTSVLAIIWLYYETSDQSKVIALSNNIFWVVIPSLVFFLVFPLLLKKSINFYASLLMSCAVTAVTYSVYLFLLKKFGIELDH